MSRDPEEVNKLTENTYKNVMEQFNPGLRNLINLGKNYEKAVNVMVVAGRAYYDSLAKIGDISADSPVSKELGCLQKAELLLSNYRTVERNGCADSYEMAEKAQLQFLQSSSWSVHGRN